MLAKAFPLPPHIASLSERRAQIDGLRAIAMAGVLYVHFWNDHPTTEFIRVSLFFTVSGFLITHMLYKARARGGDMLPLNFYIRRALRLFPALAVLVLFGAIFDIDDFRARAWWHLLQLSNVSFAHYQEVRPNIAGHLWSLNVLEQFYLLWPLVMFYLAVSDIYLAIVVLWIAIVFLRTNAGHVGINSWYAWATLAADPILVGAMTYLLCLFAGFANMVRSRVLIVASLAVCVLPLVLWKGFGESSSYRLLLQPALGVIVANAFFGYGGPVGWLFETRLVAFLSRISYGVYMYHLLVFWMFTQIHPITLGEYGPGTVALLVGATLIFATLSWYLIEEPISRLKTRFPTRRNTGTQPTAAVDQTA